MPLFLDSYSAMCLTLPACYTAAVSTPAVAGIADIAGGLTVAGLPASAGVPDVVGVHAVATSDFRKSLHRRKDVQTLDSRDSIFKLLRSLVREC